jgi:tetratricopeptide (TPR) repeat protein
MRFRSRRVAFVLVFVAAVALSAAADTIVLKSGRRIRATNVVEEDDHVSYETSAGRLSLQKSLVDHVERGAGTDMSTGSSSSNAKSSPAAEIASGPPPAVSSAEYDAVAKAVIAGGSIDRDYIARLEGQAASGGKEAVARVAYAQHVAAQFELQRGDIKAAADRYRRGLTYAPEDLGLLLNVSYLLLRQSQYVDALEYLERARRVDPKSPDVAKLMGWAYSGQNKMEQAVVEWKKALALRPDAEIQRALEKAQRDQEEEAGYREGVSSHFQIRYSGAAAPQPLVREILRTLENHFLNIESALNYAPVEPIGVVLYTDQAFKDVTRAPSWAGALNDGRIRVPVQGLTGMSSELSRTLKHELTHSFIAQKTRLHCPTWLNEGVAQWMEGASAGDSASAFVSAFDHMHQTISLGALEGSWTALPGDDAHVAYGWALSVVEFIVKQGGPVDIERMLDRLATGADPQSTTKSVLHMDYPELEEATIKYLKTTYVR